jgi:hypothetical protein
MYFIYNSTFAILEDLRILKDGLGSKLHLMDKTNYGRR